MKVQYTFWRNRLVREECLVEIDVPDALAGDPYLADSIAKATMNMQENELPWEEKGSSTERRGEHKTRYDEDE